MQVAYMALQNLFYKQDNLDSAYFYQQKLIEINDQLNQSERTEGIDMIEIRNKYQQELLLKEINHKKQRIIFWLIMAIILGVSLTVFLLLRLKMRAKQLENEKLNREKQMLEKEMELKSLEMTYKILNISNQNQLINKVIDVLTSGSNVAPDEKNSVNEIVSELRLHQKLDLWEAFEKEFTKIHPDFFTRLASEYPNLTHYEMRLCAFLKLNMNSKEMADILHLNVDSIIKARYRLRKKLNLTGSDEGLNSMFAKF
jgi:DNA-binding CsgD family transcriptional regulator